MKVSNRVHKATWGVFVVALILLAGSSAAQNQDQRVPSGLDRLQISIQLDQPQPAASSVPRFRVELRNAGEKNLLLNLGTLALDGREQYPTAISLILTTPGGPQRLAFVKPRQDTEAESEPLLLPLPVGASFSIPVDLANYHAAGSNDRSYELKPGTYVIVAQFIPPSATSAAENFPSAENFPPAPLRNRQQVPLTDPRLVPITEQPFDHVVHTSIPIFWSAPLQFEVGSR